MDRLDWQFATEAIVVKIRWFGIFIGYALVVTRSGTYSPAAAAVILALGAVYAALDTWFHRRGEVFLSHRPLFVSSMEATFIGLLCFFDEGAESPFRWYYLLSAICVAIRYRPVIAACTLILHAVSMIVLAYFLSLERTTPSPSGLLLTFAVLAWATWASSSLAGILKSTGIRLEQANAALARHGAELERRVAERTAELRASRARLHHQEKMAAFGLLSAGIAHEVGNPLAALSSLIQMLRRRDPDPYTDGKLELAENQLDRIRRTIRELIDFSSPARLGKTTFSLQEAVSDALGIAKYYHRTKERRIETRLPDDLPLLHSVKDHVVQVVLNLLLNAIDATEKDGLIQLVGSLDGASVRLDVADDGRGISEGDRARVFQPYFTTKPTGTGLGLFVSRQIATDLDGSLEFQSEPGRGTAFTLTLPALELVGVTESERVAGV